MITSKDPFESETLTAHFLLSFISESRIRYGFEMDLEMELQEVPVLVTQNFSEIEMPRASGEVDELHIPCQSPCGRVLEVLGALLSVQLIWLISGVLIYEAVNRLLVKDAPVNGKIMFAVAVFGFLTNLIMVLWLQHDHSHHGCGHGLHGDHSHAHHGCGHGDHSNDNHGDEESTSTAEEKINLISSSPDKGKTLNINLQGAYLHVLADMIQSIGVIIAGAIIWAKPDWLVVDLICTLIFSTFAVSTTITMLRSIFDILMERTPSAIDISNLETSLKSIKGVHDVHDLHVWSVTMGKVAMACHVKAEAGVSSRDILLKTRDFCEKTYRINHVTIQIEEE
ncbi:Cation efflux protein [Dillenia turbinata]|uniref:Cation efflux protein n=1 Tax=Dillenia turbinata TaxID=194707 RepID=A0AAN8VIP6_9MAGN